MSITDGVQMPMFLYLICFSIYTNMQGFRDKCIFLHFTQKFKMTGQMAGNDFLEIC